MQPIRIKACSESDLRMLGNLARNIQRVLPVTQADIDAAAALGKGWVVWKVIEVNDPIDNLRGGTQLVIKQNSITPGQNVRRVLIVQGPGGETVVVGPGPSPLLLPDAIANSLSYVKAFGGTEQNGTPTPDAPVDIVSNNGVLKYSKNLLDMSAENIVLGKYINNSGVATDSGPNFYNSKYIPVVAGGVYTWSTSSSINFFSVMEYDSNYVFKKRTLFSNAGTSGSITLRSDTAFVLIGSNMDSTDVTLDRIAAVDWQFEKGSSATAYKPYSPTGIYTDGTVETINAHGKNLFDIDTIGIEQGAISSTSGGNTNSSTRVRTTHSINCKPNTTYTLSAVIDGYTSGNSRGLYIFEYDDTDFLDSDGWINAQSYTFTTSANTTRLRFVFAKSGSASNPTVPEDISNVQLELGSTATEYAPYYDGGTATAEMLLKVGDYQDVQSIIDGVVTRNVGIKVLDGTEPWIASGTYLGSCYTNIIGQTPSGQVICSHFQNTSGLGNYSRGKCYKESTSFNLWYGDNRTTAVADLKQFLADQYAAGTPVIVIYPLATPTTESVAGQTLQVEDGDNTLEITQASLSGLELEAEYTKVA